MGLIPGRGIKILHVGKSKDALDWRLKGDRDGTFFEGINELESPTAASVSSHPLPKKEGWELPEALVTSTPGLPCSELAV